MKLIAASLRGLGVCAVLLCAAHPSQAQAPPVVAPDTQPVAAPKPADWLVEHPPVTRDASPEAKALLHYLYTISGKHTMTGQHNYAAQQEFSTGLATGLTGKVPALYGTDWGFAAAGDKDSAYVRRDTVRELIKQWRQGSVIAICWHAPRPTEDEPVTFRQNVQGHITDEQFNELLTPGSDVYKHWCVQVDVIAEYLKQLQDAHVPVLWRPYHEINGDWFWWNGRRGDAAHGSKQLYRLMFDRLVNFHHLNNLLWVWNCDQPTRADKQFADYFPGQDSVDVLALDCYGPFQQSFYDQMNALSDGKVMAVSETSNPPSLEIYDAQPKWAYYMKWAVDKPVPGGRPPRLMTGGPNIRATVSAPRMFSLSDPAYRQAITPVRAASGLPPLAAAPAPP